jgi:glycosyltransferase involved in cell wall biosynthesis
MKEGGLRLRNNIQAHTESIHPRVTIITVTYNAGNFLQACIDSVASQAFQNIEHIIFDGGSTDNTLEILQSNPQISYWRSEPDQGIYNAMNKAIRHAKGDWLLFLGADDTLLPGFSELARLLTDHQCVYYGESQWLHMIHGGPFTPYRLAKFNICHQNIFYPKSVFDHYHYQEDYKVSADYHLNILLFTDHRFRFEFHPILVSIYAAGGFSTQNTDLSFNKDRDKIVKENFGRLIYLRYKLRQFRHFIKGKK